MRRELLNQGGRGYVKSNWHFKDIYLLLLFDDKGEGVVTKMITSFMNDPFRIYASLILAGLCNEQVTGVQIFRNICVMTKEIITISDIC